MPRNRLWLALALVGAIGVSCDTSTPDDEQCDEGGTAAAGHDHDHAATGAAEHGAEACGEDGEFGPPTQSTCPDGSTLTYDNFGKPFMETYCTQCHASTLSGDARQGAPLYHDFDSLEGILPVADHIDEKAAAGPAATNEFMPEVDPKPSLAERKQLGEWLACELAKM